MTFWFYLALAFAYLAFAGFATSAVMAWLDRRRTLHQSFARLRANEERAAAILAYYRHVPACNCGLLFGGGVLRVDARCVCWTRRSAANELAQKENGPGANPTQNSLPVH